MEEENDIIVFKRLKPVLRPNTDDARIKFTPI